MANQFRHQQYRSTRPTSPHHLLKPPPCPAVDSAEFAERMRLVGQRLRAAGVSVIYLSHGTFAGNDAFGLVGELGRLFPASSDFIRGLIKQLIDAVAADVGNYTSQYARLFEDSINAEGESRIEVRRFNWSSENHHIGRADGAVRLLDELSARRLAPGERALLWGHSHAGNVFALLTNLLSGDRAAIEQFFKAACVYYRWPLLGCIDIPLWRRVRELLLAEESPESSLAAECSAPNALRVDGRQLDIVTFGTPIRYGWDAAGYARLLHFVNHHPSDGLPEYRAPFPPKLENVLAAVDGDYVQQFGIAGTNFMPSLFCWRAWWADNRLNRLLQGPHASFRQVERFQAGVRVPESGTTLLVDYGLPGGTVAQHFAGHAVYTKTDWLLFHAEEVVGRLYAG